MRARVWHEVPPPRPRTYSEWLDLPAVPCEAPSDWSQILRPSEALRAAWAPFAQRPVDLSCRRYAKDAS
eukprot:3538038-Pyramimonas_sp.AAC.1